MKRFTMYSYVTWTNNLEKPISLKNRSCAGIWWTIFYVFFSFARYTIIIEKANLSWTNIWHRTNASTIQPMYIPTHNAHTVAKLTVDECMHIFTVVNCVCVCLGSGNGRVENYWMQHQIIQIDRRDSRKWQYIRSSYLITNCDCDKKLLLLHYACSGV